MALAASALQAAGATGPTLCGHDHTGSTMTLNGDEGKRYCGRCWQRYRHLATDYQKGAITRGDLAAGLTRLLTGFAPSALRGADLDSIHTEVAAAIASIDEDK